MSVHSDDIALKCARPRLLHRVYTNSKNCVFISFFREISPRFGSLPRRWISILPGETT